MSIRSNEEDDTTAPIPVPPEERWADHAVWLAEKMAKSGVKSFHVMHKIGDKYTFDVIPMPPTSTPKRS